MLNEEITVSLKNGAEKVRYSHVKVWNLTHNYTTHKK